MQKATVSTDGSCLTQQNEGRGPIGWAWTIHSENLQNKDILKQERFISKNSGGLIDGTNQIAELMAVHNALKTFAPNTDFPIKDLIIESDSKYVIDIFTKWIEGWKLKNWKNSQKKLISNYDLIVEIDQEITKRKNAGGTVEFEWIKGHSGNIYNEMVDEMARNEATKYKKMIQN